MRKSPRELSAEIEDMAGSHAGDHPRMNLAVLLVYDWEPVDRERGLWRAETGEVYHAPESFINRLHVALPEPEGSA